jgi:hypothetical protein
MVDLLENQATTTGGRVATDAWSSVHEAEPYATISL